MSIKLPWVVETMRLLFDIAVLGMGSVEPSARTGIFRVIESIVNGLAAARECDIVFCTSQDNFTNCYDYLRSKPELSSYAACMPENIATYLAGLYSTRASRSEILLDKLKQLVGHRKKVDLYHSPYFPIPDEIKRIPRIARFQTVHDLIPVLLPQYFTTDGVKSVTSMLKRLDEDDNIICVSESTKNDLCNYAKAIDPQKVFVIHSAASASFYPCMDEALHAAIRAKYAIPEGSRYILSVCTLEPRKNVDQTIRSFVRLVKEQHINDLCLVLTGTKGWDYDRIFAEIDNAAEVMDRIILTGFVPDKDLSPLYSGALAFVYPSLYEGFGLPPLEAMQCGTPVITSNTSSLPEVVGDAGIMVDPTDGEALCQAMLTVYHDEGLRRLMAEKSLKRAKLFDWEKCVKETIELYKMTTGS
jgi:glycosyltransferase involved in cell wall biosynthesis